MDGKVTRESGRARRSSGGRGRGRGRRRGRGSARARAAAQAAAYAEAEAATGFGEIVEARGKEVQKIMMSEIMMATVGDGDVAPEDVGRAAAGVFFSLADSWTDAHAIRLELDAMHCVASGNMQLRGEKKGLKVTPEVRKAFVESFLTSFKPAASALAKSSQDYRRISRLLQLSFYFLAGAYKTYELAIIKAKFLEGQCQLLECLSKSPREILEQVFRAAKVAVYGFGVPMDEKKKQEGLIKGYLNIAGKKPGKRMMALSLASVLSPTIPVQEWAEKVLVEKLKSMDLRTILSCSPHLHTIQNMSEASLKSKILPDLITNLKKTPDTAMQTLGALAGCLAMDCNWLLKDTLVHVVSELKHDNVERREKAIFCIRELARHTDDQKVLTEALTKIGEVIVAKKAKPISSWQTRLSFVKALKVIGKSIKCGTKARKDLSTRPILDLLSLMKKEPSDEVRRLSLQTIIDWTIQRQVIPAKVLARFTRGLTASSKSLDRNIISTYLSAMLRLSDKSLYLPFENAKAVKDHIESLRKLVKDGSSSKQLRGLAVGAFAALSNELIQKANKTSGETAGSSREFVEEFQRILRDPSSVLNKPDAIQESKSEEALNHISLASSLITYHWPLLKPQAFTPLDSAGEDVSAKKSDKDKKKSGGKKKGKKSSTPSVKRGEKKEDTKLYTQADLKSPVECSPYSALLKGFLRLGLHPSSEVRRRTRDQISRLVEDNPMVGECLMHEVLKLFDDLQQEKSNPKEVPTWILMGEDEVGDVKQRSNLTSPSREGIMDMARRILVTLASQRSPTPLSVALTALNAHHPVFGEAWELKRSAWKCVCSAWRKMRKSKAGKADSKQVSCPIANILQRSATQIQKLMFSTEGLRSSTPPRVMAWIQFGETLMRLLPGLVSTSLIPKLLVIFSASDLNKLNAYEREVVNAREGEIVDEVRHKRRKGTSAYSASISNVRSRNKAYSAEEEQWAREQMAKKKEEEKMKEMTIQLEKDKLAQAALRKEIAAKIISPLAASLALTTSFARGNPSESHDLILQALFPKILALVRDNVIGRDALHAILGLSRCLKDIDNGSLPLPIADQVCRAVGIGVELGKKFASRALESKIVSNALGALLNYLSGKTVDQDDSKYEDDDIMEVDDEAADLEEDEDRDPTLLSSPSLDLILELLDVIIAPSVAEGEEEDSKGRVLIPADFVEKAGKLLTMHCGEDWVMPASFEEDVKQQAKLSESIPLVRMGRLLLYLLDGDSEIHHNMRRRVRSSFFKLSQALPPKDLSLLFSDIGALSPSLEVRLACHNALSMRDTTSLQASGPMCVCVCWMGQYDKDEYIKRAAKRAFSAGKLIIPGSFNQPEFKLISLLEHKTAPVRAAAARGIAAALLEYPDAISATIEILTKLFNDRPDRKEKVKPRPGEFAETIKTVYLYPTRHAICVCLASCSPNLMALSGSGRAAAERRGRYELERLFEFFISSAFKDMNDMVWTAALDAGLALIGDYGEKFTDSIIPMLEAHLTLHGGEEVKKNSKIQQVEDRVREGVVICLGNAARYLPEESPKLRNIVRQLIEMLGTPSYDVQVAVSECLVHLLPKLQADGKAYVDQCFAQLGAATYGARRGAAFGLGGIIKGLGLDALKEYGVLDELIKRITNKNSYKVREGALFAYERLFAMLGHRFEPFLMHILPHLLKSFGDSSKDVRRATQDACKMIMASITENGMKVLMPLVLRSLSDKKWRTKLESISLLGSMAHCNSAQLGKALPTVVPRLLQALTDPHEEVQRGSRRALKQIGDVISNPEIRQSISAVLAALVKPSNNQIALQRLINTSFVHTIDAAALALLFPLLSRGLRDRANKNKQMAAQIVGSICTLVADMSDLTPYAPRIIQQVKAIISDNSPTVRKVAAVALGSLYKGLGEKEMPGIMDELLDTLKGQTNAVQRSGAALGVAHLLVVMGKNSVDSMLPAILDGVRDQTPTVREGFANLFITLPEAFGQKFTPFIPNVLGAILEMLDDKSVEVRSLALQSGHSIAQMYSATNQIESILPTLEKGLSDSQWRSRMGACHITGTYLCNLAGASGQVIVPNSESEELVDANDDAKEGAKVTTTKMHMIMAHKIGMERRNRVLSLIYLMRSDTVHLVANTAWRVWKAVVVNSPATLSSIFPTLINLIIAALASPDQEEQHSAGQALGGIVQKMGVGVLREIVPLLQLRLTSEDEATRQGVCLGLCEVMRSTSKKRVAEYVPDLIAAVRDALCDESENVRRVAGAAFQTLHSMVGHEAIDQIVPALVEQLSRANDLDADATLDEKDGEYIDSELVLGGIRQILSTHSRLVLPFLIPQLAVRPLTPFCAQALASLSAVLGSSFYRYIEDVTKAFIEAIETAAEAGNGPKRTEFVGYAAQLVKNVRQDAVDALVATLCEVIHIPSSKPHAHDKTAAVELIGRFASETKCDLTDSLESLLSAPISLLAHTSPGVLKPTVVAVAAVLKHIPREQSLKYIAMIQDIIRDVTHDASMNQFVFELPGLNIKGALRPFLPILTDGLMKGNEKTKELAASTMGTLISLTASSTLYMYVMLMTGPLIRMASEQYSEEVKLAILRALRNLLMKCGPRVKAFFSALQTTFRKALHHKSKAVRDETILGLAEMMRHNPRVDNVIQDINTQILKEPDAEIKTSLLLALKGLAIHPTGTRISKAMMQKAMATTDSLLDHQDEEVRKAAARANGSLAQFLEEGEYKRFVRNLAGEEKLGDANDRQTRMILTEATARSGKSLDSKLAALVTKMMKDDNKSVVMAAIKAGREILISDNELLDEDGESDPVAKEKLLKRIAILVKDKTGSVQYESINALLSYSYYGSEGCKRVINGSCGSAFVPLIVALDKAKPDVKFDIKMVMFGMLGLDRFEKKECEDTKNLAVAQEGRAVAICKKLASKNAAGAKALTGIVKKALLKITMLDHENALRELER
ncbi:hypothetical protein AAMO2058_000568600 [Amorphochlora amoebiformis]